MPQPGPGKKVTWNTTPPQTRSSSSRVLVEASPEFHEGANADQVDDDDDASYMDHLFAETQPEEVPSPQSQPQESQHPEYNLPPTNPFFLDASLELSDHHVPIGPETQAAQDSLERRIPMAYRRYLTANMDTSTSFPIDSSSRLDEDADISNIEESDSYPQRSSPQAPADGTSLASDLPPSPDQETGRDMQEASIEPSFSDHSSRSNVAVSRPSQGSFFLNVEGDQDTSDEIADSPFQSTCPNNSSLPNPDISRELASENSEIRDDDLDDPSSSFALNRTNVDMSSINTPDRTTRALLNSPSPSQRTDNKVVHSSNSKSTPNSPSLPRSLTASSIRDRRSTPGSSNPRNSSSESIDPSALNGVASAEDLSGSKSSGSLRQQQSQIEEDLSSSLNLNQDQVSDESREFNQAQRMQSLGEDTQGSESLDLPRANTSHSFSLAQSSVSSSRMNAGLARFASDVNPNLNAPHGTFSEGSSYDAPSTLILQPVKTSKVPEKPATSSDLSSHDAPAGPSKRSVNSRLKAPSVGPSRAPSATASTHTREANPISQPVQESYPEAGHTTSSLTRASASLRSDRSISQPARIALSPSSSRSQSLKRNPTAEPSSEVSEVRDSDLDELASSSSRRATRASTSASARNSKQRGKGKKTTVPRILVQPPKNAKSSRAAAATTKARSARGKKAGITNMVRSSTVSRVTRSAGNHSFPVTRVLAYSKKDGAFLPGEVVSTKPDQVVVEHDIHIECDYELDYVRRCEIFKGDVVRYIGSELGPQESLATNIRDPMRVVKVTKVNEEPEALDLLESEDLVWTNLSPGCFKVEGLTVESDNKKVPHLGLSDRQLSEEELVGFRKLMEASSGVGKRTRSASAAISIGLRATSAAPGGTQIFKNYRIIVTAVTDDLKEEYEKKVLSNGGTVIKHVNELYRIETGVPQTSRKVKKTTRFDSTQTTLSPAPEHCDNKTVLLIAQGPLRTTNYLMALALGIPCVSTSWVTFSCKKTYAVDWAQYVIGSGPSAFLGGSHAMGSQLRLYQRSKHDLASIFEYRAEMRTLIFKDLNFLCITNKGKAGDAWFDNTVRPILCALGAKKIERASAAEKEKIDDKDFDYVLIEDGADVSSVTTKVQVGHSNERQDRVVNLEWVKQCLIFGDMLEAQRWPSEVSAGKRKKA